MSADPGKSKAPTSELSSLPNIDGSTSGSGGSQQASAVITRKTCSNLTGAEVVVPPEVRTAIQSFTPPPGTEISGSVDQGIIYSWGCYCVPQAGKNTLLIPRFYCLASEECRSKKTVIPCRKGDRSNVNKHVKNVHNFVSKASLSRKVKEQAATEGSAKVEVATRTSRVGRDRSQELQFTVLLVKKLLPFTFAEDKEWRVLMQLATGINPSFPAPTAERVKHMLVEMYEATKKNMVSGLHDEIAAAPLPILHFSVDLWTCKVSGRKYLGYHIFWVDRNFQLHDALLSVKPYCPDTEATEPRRAAELMWKIFQSILEEFGLKTENFASCTTDNDSDVKAMCVNHACMSGILWDWCTSHMFSKAFEHAFGTSADPVKSQNRLARDLVLTVVEIIERLNKSATWRAKLEGIQHEDIGSFVKGVEHPPQRWLSLFKSFGRILRLWYPLQKLYASKGETFPLDPPDVKNGFLQLFSIMEPCATIMRDGQCGHAPGSNEVYMALSLLKTTTLDVEKPLKVFKLPNPPSVGSKGKVDFDARLETEMVPAALLSGVVRLTRRELAAALVSRFYGRVWGSDSFFKDATVMLTPPFNSGKHLDLLRLVERDEAALPNSSLAVAPTPEHCVEDHRKAIWIEIRSRALTAALEKEGSGPSKAKRMKLSMPELRSLEDTWAMLGNSSDGSGHGKQEATVEEKLTTEVDADMERFRALKVKTADVPPPGVLTFWGSRGRAEFTMLRDVAQQVFGHQASAAQIERDLVGAGQLLASCKSRTDSFYVEVLLFLHLNFEKIPGAVPVLTADAVNSCLPRRFTGKDSDLVEADNYTNPIIGGWGVGAPFRLDDDVHHLSEDDE